MLSEACAFTDTSDLSVLCSYLSGLGICFEMEEVKYVLEKHGIFHLRSVLCYLIVPIFGMPPILFILSGNFIDELRLKLSSNALKVSELHYAKKNRNQV